ncbi:MAG: S8 family serine peptidase [Thermoleophilia bacterium]|nr:S8 family serine peptidase [Thermoleophilia bacterium]
MRAKARGIYPVLAILLLLALVFAGALSAAEDGNVFPGESSKPPKEISGGMQSSLAELATIESEEGSAAATDFAEKRGLELRNGKVTVVLESSRLPGSVAAAASNAVSRGAEIQSTHGHLIQMAIPVGQIKSLSRLPSVYYIREPGRPTPFVISEGVADIGADEWHANSRDGAGAKIAVLDPGFSGYQQRIAEGELPAGVITMSFRADGDITGGGEPHGTGCAEIVHDVAPGAQLYLVNFSTDVELGNAIDYLIDEDVDVISASWGFFSVFRGDGQGIINDMVEQARNAGINWVNAAGNSAQAHWSGIFVDTDGDDLHEFAAGDIGNDLNASSGTFISLYLTWDRWPVTDQDYDMYLVYAGPPQQAVAAGVNWQTGTQPPAEELHYFVPPGKGGRYWVAIENYDAAGDANFHLYSYPYSLQYRVAAGSLGGQPTDSPHAMTVGAVPVGSTVIENFSSQGPTRDGRIKPDIVAPDRVSTVTYGPQGFWGTSAAAPHAAGAAALLKSSDFTYTPALIQDRLESGSTDLGAPGKDNVFGSGKLNMASLCGEPQLSLSSPQPYWATYADYQLRELSVDWTIHNAAHNAYDVSIVGSANTNSVSTISLPVTVGDIPEGAEAVFTLTYQVPAGIASYKSTTYAVALDACGMMYAYPEPYPGI